MSDLLQLMPHTISIEMPATYSGSGEVATYHTAKLYRCQLTGKRRLTRNNQGQEVVSGFSAILETGDVINTRARCTLTTQDVGTTDEHLRRPHIVSVHRFADEGGFEIVEILFAGSRF